MSLNWSRNVVLFLTLLFEFNTLIPPSLAGPSEPAKLEFIVQSCKNGLDFDSIKEYRRFAETFKQLGDDHLRDDKIPKECVRDHDAILELDKLLSTKEVCDPDRIDDLIEYHKTHFKSGKFFHQSRAITHNFFEKYAIQVAHVCKKNLVKNLKIAREELHDRSKTFDEARDKVFQEEPTIKSNIKMLQEQPDDPASTNVKPRDQVEIILSEYREALTKLSRPEDILTFERDDCLRNKRREMTILQEKMQTFFKPALMCHQLHRYYAGSTLSIAKLANYGYTATDAELDVAIADDSTVRDWIIAAQVCEPMLHIGTVGVKGDSATIDTCSKKVMAIEPMVYDDQFEDLDIESLKEMVPNSKATRGKAQRLMKSALKKMAKADMMQQIRMGVSKKSIFSKSLSVFSRGSTQALESPKTVEKFSVQVNENIPIEANEHVKRQLTDEQSFEILMKVVNDKNVQSEQHEENTGEIDSSVSVFDPMSTLASTLTIMAIMLGFEWLFFIVMTLAARICHNLYFEFDNILTFPPKILSWSDADFARYNDRLERMDEDDFFDYDELSPDEQQQRDLLSQVFGRPPPMLFRD